VNYSGDKTTNNITHNTSILAKNKMLCVSSDISCALREYSLLKLPSPEVLTGSCSSAAFGRIREKQTSLKYNSTVWAARGSIVQCAVFGR
jgi:hypothetical protein